jgi:hypothetical protein
MSEDHPYSNFLNGWKPETDGLTQVALEDIQKSGLSPEILELAQVRLFRGGPDDLKKRLGFGIADGQSIPRSNRLVEFPYFNEDGTVNRYEFKAIPELQFPNEEKPRKYLQAKGEKPTPYVTRDVWAAKNKANSPLWFTEGVKKVLKLLQHGKLAVGLSGVYNFRAGKKRQDEESRYLWKDLEDFTWKGRTVYIAFDADLWDNTMVRHALYELAFTLFARGAVLRFPLWRGAKGIDDYLTLHEDPDAALEELEATAKTLEGLLCPDHRNEIMAALSRLEELDGFEKETLVAMVAKKLDLKSKDVKKELVRLHRKKLQGSENIVPPPYFVNDNCEVCQLKPVAGDPERIVILSNFVARFTEEVTVDNGLGVISKFFVIEGKTKTRKLPGIQIPFEQFNKMDWPINNWGHDAIIGPGHTTKDSLRHFIQRYSEFLTVQYRTIYGHTGWKEIDGKWCYLMANGAIGADGVSVDLSRGGFLNAGRYCLPLKSENEIDAVKLVLDFFMMKKREIWFPAIACVFLSPLTTLLEPDPAFALYFYGEKDTFKTAVAALMLAFFGSHNKTGLPNFDSTHNSLIQMSTTLKDTLMVVDDYYPSPNQRAAADKEDVAQKLIRALGNRTSRGRLDRNSSQKVSPPPQCMLILTGELLAQMQSTLARVLAIRFSKGDIDPAELEYFQAKATLLPHAMTSYILWLRDHIPDIQAQFKKEFSELRKRASEEIDSRKVSEQMAFLYFALSLLSKWVIEKTNSLQENEEERLKLAWNVLIRLGQQQAQRVDREDPVTLIFEILHAQIKNGTVMIEQRKDTSKGRIGGTTGIHIGYYDDSFFYFLPTPLWNAIQRWFANERGHFPLTKNTLWESLRSQEYLETQNGKSNTTKRIDGKPTAVLKMRREKIDPLIMDTTIDVEDDEHDTEV